MGYDVSKYQVHLARYVREHVEARSRVGKPQGAGAGRAGAEVAPACIAGKQHQTALHVLELAFQQIAQALADWVHTTVRHKPDICADCGHLWIFVADACGLIVGDSREVVLHIKEIFLQTAPGRCVALRAELRHGGQYRAHHFDDGGALAVVGLAVAVGIGWVVDGLEHSLTQVEQGTGPALVKPLLLVEVVLSIGMLAVDIIGLCQVGVVVRRENGVHIILVELPLTLYRVIDVIGVFATVVRAGDELVHEGIMEAQRHDVHNLADAVLALCLCCKGEDERLVEAVVVGAGGRVVLGGQTGVDVGQPQHGGDIVRRVPSSIHPGAVDIVVAPELHVRGTPVFIGFVDLGVGAQRVGVAHIGLDPGIVIINRIYKLFNFRDEAVARHLVFDATDNALCSFEAVKVEVYLAVIHEAVHLAPVVVVLHVGKRYAEVGERSVIVGSLQHTEQAVLALVVAPGRVVHLAGAESGRAVIDFLTRFTGKEQEGEQGFGGACLVAFSHGATVTHNRLVEVIVEVAATDEVRLHGRGVVDFGYQFGRVGDVALQLVLSATVEAVAVDPSTGDKSVALAVLALHIVGVVHVDLRQPHPDTSRASARAGVRACGSIGKLGGHCPGLLAGCFLGGAQSSSNPGGDDFILEVAGQVFELCLQVAIIVSVGGGSLTLGIDAAHDLVVFVVGSPDHARIVRELSTRVVIDVDLPPARRVDGWHCRARGRCATIMAGKVAVPNEHVQAGLLAKLDVHAAVFDNCGVLRFELHLLGAGGER